jgi:hypothetical protein
MARQTFKIPQRHLNLGIQNMQVLRHFPDFKGTLYSGMVVWEGALQPRSLSPVYKVEIQYKLEDKPHVWVLDPPLVKGVPHLYRDNSLCLYWPREWNWHPDKLVAFTIIPWTASWLYYYELWLDTGKWLGPSSHEVIK